MRRCFQLITVIGLGVLGGAPVWAQSDSFIGPSLPAASGAEQPAVEPETESALLSSHPAAAIESRPLGMPEAQGETSLLGRSSPASSRLEGASVEAGPGWWRTAGALVLVIVAILGVAAVARKFASRSNGLMHAIGAGGRAPSGLLEVLGRYPVGRGQTLILLKLDRRVLLLCQSVGTKGAGMRTLCEVTEPDEVASLLLHTAEADGRSISARFREMVSGFDESHERREAAMQPIPVYEAEQRRASDPVNQLASRLDGLRRRGVEVSA